MIIKTIHNEILQSCTYILTDESSDECYLIDCGDVVLILDYVIKYNKYIKGIFLTHSHYDHIYGVNEMLKSYPKLPIYASKGTIDGLADPDINLSYMYDDGDYIVENATSIEIPQAGLTILNNETIIPLSTPGHDQDCTSYIIGNSIFTGDSYNPDFPVFTKWRRSNEEEADSSIATILQLVEEKQLTIYPGHYK
ncbi:MAG: MBL fold metallo-hydrolase [Bacteroidaceae bacterium]|nr:MBL fold metallo-hydrolase [Bacteroidaceae bacterium]